MERIPFGWHVDTAALTDVADVAQGQNCGCICPSCKARLVAKHGHVKVWHFAHAAESGSTLSDVPCTYSAWVSMRQMALQQLADFQTLSFRLPAYRLRAGTGPLVAIAEQVTLTECRTQVASPYGSADFFGRHGDHEVLIFLAHPERAAPEPRLEAPTPYKVLFIDLEPIWDLFVTQVEPRRSCSELLRDVLAAMSGLKWIDHPELKRVLELDRAQSNKAQQARDAVEREKRARWAINVSDDAPTAASLGQRSGQPAQLMHLHCSICDHNWEGYVKRCPRGCGEICVSSSQSWRR